MSNAIDVSDLIRSVLDASKRDRRNQSRKLAASAGTLNEIPIAIQCATTNVLTTPEWAPFVQADPVLDRFTVTGASVNLNTHTSDSGDSWTARSGQIDATNRDEAEWVSGTPAIYTVDRASGDMRVGVSLSKLAATSNLGIVFRYQDTSNYWIFFSDNQATPKYKLVRIGGGDVATNIQTAVEGDYIEVVLTGSTIVCQVNNRPVYAGSDSNLSTQTKCGIYMDTTGQRVDDFRAWDITDYDIGLEFTTDPGHTFYGSPEVWG